MWRGELSRDDSDAAVFRPRSIWQAVQTAILGWRSNDMRVGRLSVALIFALSAGAGQGVFAADMPVKMPVDKIAPIASDWGGRCRALFGQHPHPHRHARARLQVLSHSIRGLHSTAGQA